MLRQCVGCRPLDGDRGIEINIPLGMLLMIFMGLVGLLRRLPFKEGGRDMARVIVHDWRRVIRRQSIRVSHPIVSQMGVAVVPLCIFSRPIAFGGGWCVVARRVGSASAAELTAAAVATFFSMSCLIPNMASIMEAICSFRADMSAFICSCVSS